MSEKIQIVCGHCGSSNVERDAWAQWDTETQQWTLGSVFDDGHCSTCDGEARLEEMPLSAWETSLLETHELDGLEYRAEEAGDGTIFAVVLEADVGEIWRVTEDHFFKTPFSDREEALNEARSAIMQERVRA